MNGYPGDEHVFSVVVIVLARSPDCNSRILVTLRLLQLCCCVQVCDLCVFHLLAGLWAVKVSVVSVYKVCRVSCVSCRLISKQQLTSDAAAVKRTAVFTTGFGAAVEGSKSEHTTSCDWSFGTRRVDECLNNERSVRIPSCDNLRNSGSQDCCWRTILCEGVQGSSAGFFGNLLGKGLKSGCREFLKKIE